MVIRKHDELIKYKDKNRLYPSTSWLCVCDLDLSKEWMVPQSALLAAHIKCLRCDNWKVDWKELPKGGVLEMLNILTCQCDTPTGHYRGHDGKNYCVICSRVKMEREESDNKVDLVNHPPHYTQHPSGIECIQITEHMNFCCGNAVKYLWRTDHKDDDLQDLEKAIWYIQREIARRKGLRENDSSNKERR